MILHRTEQEKIRHVVLSLCSKIGSEAVLLAHRSGQPIAVAGDLAIQDMSSLASLSAGAVAAACGLARLIGEHELLSMDCRGQNRDIRLLTVGEEAVLVIVQKSGVPLPDSAAVRQAWMILADILRKTRKGTPE